MLRNLDDTLPNEIKKSTSSKNNSLKGVDIDITNKGEVGDNVKRNIAEIKEKIKVDDWKNILISHRIVHDAYSEIEEKNELEKIHAKIVRAMINENLEHKLVSELDGKLPNNLKSKSLKLTKAELSFYEIEKKVSEKIRDEYGDLVEDEWSIWITDIYPSYAIVYLDSEIYKINYTLGKDDEVTLGNELVPVERKWVEKQLVQKTDNIKNTESEVDQMDLKEVKNIIEKVITTIEGENKDKLQKILAYLNENRVVEVSNIGAIAENIKGELKDHVAKAEYDNLVKEKTKLEEELNSEKAKHEATKAEYAEFKTAVEKEKEEARKSALADKRFKELEEAGIKFAENRKEKIIAKLKEMSDEEYAEYKDELLEVKGEQQPNKSQALKQDNRSQEDDDEEDFDIRVSTMASVFAGLNIESEPKDKNKVLEYAKMFE